MAQQGMAQQQALQGFYNSLGQSNSTSFNAASLKS
jgi:hypothetical protein